MQNPGLIVVSLQEGQAGLNIVRWAVGVGNHTGLSDGMIAIEQAQEVIFNSDHRYR
jgi:hypothetical protein